MGSISAGDLALLQSDDTIYTKEKLWFFGLPAMWKGRVNNGSIARGDQTILCDGGAMQGDFALADLVTDLLVLFGTSEGADDLGRRRLLSISGTAAAPTLIVDWYDDMELSDNDYVTIVHNFPPWPRFSWFTASPTDFRVDGPPSGSGGAGIDYSDQNEDPPPLVLIGRHGVVERSSVDTWWLTSTALSSDCLAAWQGVGAESKAASYINLNNPGTYDLTEGAGAVTWTAGEGWDFSGSEYLETGITPSDGYTIIIRYRCTTNTMTGSPMGQKGTNSQLHFEGTIQSPTVTRFTADYGVGTVGSGWAVSTSGGADMVFALTNNRGILSKAGVVQSNQTFSSTWTNTAEELLIGASSDAGGGVSDYIDDYVIAAAVYNRVLTNTEMLEVMGNMADIDATQTFGLALDATASQAVASGASLSTYAWSYTPSGAPGTILNNTASQATFIPAAGYKYIIHCTVTDSNGKSDTAHRCVIADDSADTFAAVEFQRNAMTEQRDKMVDNAKFTLTSPDTNKTGVPNPNPTLDYSDVVKGSVVIVTRQDYFGDTEGLVSFRDDSQFDGRHNIRYSGYVFNVRRVMNDFTGLGQIEIDALSTIEFFMYNASLEGNLSPSDWYQMDTSLMYTAAIIHNLLRWRSTLANIMDWYLPWSDTYKRSAVYEWAEGSFMDRLRGIAGPYGRLFNTTMTLPGEAYIESNINLLSQSDRNSVTTTLTLQNRDIDGDKIVRYQLYGNVSQVFLSGGYSEGIISSFVPHLSVSQNVHRAEGSQRLNFERLILPSETEANRLCGRLLSIENQQIRTVELVFNSAYSHVFSPADQQWTNTGTEIFATSLLSNLDDTTELNSIRLVPISVTIEPPPTGQIRVVFEVEAPEGLAGRTVVLPEIDPDYVPQSDTTKPSQNDPVVNVLITGDDTNGVEIYIPDNAAWETRNTGLTGDNLKVNDLRVAPFWPLLQGTTDYEYCILWIVTDAGILTSEDMGKSWTDKTPFTDAVSGFNPSSVDFLAFEIYGSATDVNRTMVFAAYDGSTHSYIGISTNGGNDWTIAQRANTQTLDFIIDQYSGLKLYECYLVSSNLYVAQRDTTLALVGSAEDFGAATGAEITARTYKLNARHVLDPTDTDNADYVLAYGRMQKT